MCVFCAAVPAAVSLGAVAKAKQNQAKHETTAAADAIPHPAPNGLLALPAERVTGVVVVCLIAGSVVVHSRITPI